MELVQGEQKVRVYGEKFLVSRRILKNLLYGKKEDALKIIEDYDPIDETTA